MILQKVVAVAFLPFRITTHIMIIFPATGVIQVLHMYTFVYQIVYIHTHKHTFMRMYKSAVMKMSKNYLSEEHY